MAKKILLLVLTLIISILVSKQITNQNFISKNNEDVPITLVAGDQEYAKVQPNEILPRKEIQKKKIFAEDINDTKSIRHEQREDIIQSEKVDSIVAAIESNREDWNIFRSQVYSNLEIDPFQKEQLQMARSHYQTYFDELAGGLNHANSEAIKEQIISSLKNLHKSFDTDVEIIVGSPKFQQMKHQRDKFNQWLLSKSEIDTRVGSDW